MKRQACYAWAFICLFASSAGAEDIVRPQLIQTPRRSAAPLLPDNQYAIEMRCSARNGALEDPSDLFRQRNRSLFVLIAPNAPSTVDKLPSNLLAAVQVYSIGTDATTRQALLVDDRECSKDFLVNGKSDIGIVVTDNRIDNYSNSVFGQVLSGTLGLLSPLFSLFTGGAALPAVVTGRFSDVTAVQQATATILNALNRGKNYTRPIRGLKVGTYVIRSDYAVVTITIRPVASIVLDKNPAFKNDLKTQVNSASVKVDAGNIAPSCRGAQYDIYSLGFRSPIDLAYSLTQLAAHAGFTIPQSVTCLTDQYASAASSADDRFWGNFPPAFRIKAKDVQDTLVPSPDKQPTWDGAQPTIDALVLALARYSRNNPPSDSAVSELTRLLAPQVVIKDKTTLGRIGGTGEPEERLTAINHFKQAGYIRFGCYAPTDDTTDQKVDGATSMFLVFNAPNDSDSATLKQALVIRPQFYGKTISSMTIYDNRARITAVLKKRDYDCNDFSVERPAAEIARR